MDKIAVAQTTSSGNWRENIEKAKQYINSKHRVDKIYQYLIHNLNNKKLINQMEKVIINEGRKV